MLKRSLKYAVVCGIFITCSFLLSLALGGNPFLDLSHLLFDVFLFGLFAGFAMYEFKRYQNQGFLRFWQGMSLGFTVYTPATLLFAIALVIYFQVSPEALAEYKSAALAFLEADKAAYLEKFSEKEYLQEIEDINSVTISSMVINSVLKKIIAGFFVTPVISIILRNNPKS